MERETVSKMFSLIVSEICPDANASGACSFAVGNEEAVEIFEMCDKHDIAQIVAPALKKCGAVLEPELAKRLDDKMYSAVFRAEQQAFETERIMDALSKAEIPFIMLKGAVLRKLYPENWLRTSSDIDILVKPEEHDKAADMIIGELGYTLDSRTAHDVALMSAGGVCVELHFDLVEKERFPKASTILQRVWEFARPSAENEFMYRLSDEFIYFYHTVHTAKHIFNGGCGIRPLVDLYLLERAEHDKGHRDELLKEGCLLRFADVSRELVNAWFCGGDYSDILCALENYILEGGVYGTLENNVVANRRKYASRMSYYFHRLFLPKRQMQARYPYLQKFPWLMPVGYVQRVFGALSSDSRGRLKYELEVSGRLTEGSIDEFSSLISEIGL